MVPEAGLEPARTNRPQDFKSCVSTIPPLGRKKSGAGNEIRTRDPNLGKVVLYP